MLLEILKHTPPWVFVLFAALVYLGAMQGRTRQLSLARVAIMPFVLLGLALSVDCGAHLAPMSLPSLPGWLPLWPQCCSTGSRNGRARSPIPRSRAVSWSRAAGRRWRQ